ncbi:MAG: sigma-54 dependent transcriptional regulator [Balneolales bacterium]|nr:sigma-54 dependent transcriptional regulator [Balneolales bacterium]
MSRELTILIADDEASMRRNLCDVLHDEGYTTIEAEDGTAALEIALRDKPDLILLDIKMPGINGMKVLEHVKREHPSIPIIIFTAFGNSERPIEAMKLGAYDYIDKPFDLEELLLVIHRALDYACVLDELNELRSQVSGQTSMQETLVGSSSKMQHIFKMIGKIANSDATVLLQGESGTGKEMIADAIQRYSKRFAKPFIKVNCGALPETLLESELFGHESGSFTGANKKRIGRFELADEGTIFLDEVDSMSHTLQVKLLRVLQQQTFERVGGEITLQVNLRVICATNQNLEEKVRSGQFREDLYYRLNVIHIKVPPLREHTDDIPTLVDHFLEKYKPGEKVIVSRKVIDTLLEYKWPGNVRELENIIQRALVMTDGDVITVEHLPIFFQDTKSDEISSVDLTQPNSLKEILQNVEKKAIMQALEKSDWNQTKAAALLQINRRQLFTKIKQYRLKQ